MAGIPTVSELAQAAMKTFADNIADARTARDWTQQFAASNAGIGRNSYWLIEQGALTVAFGSYWAVLHSMGLAATADMDAIPAKIKEARIEQGLSMQEASMRAGISRSTYHNIEKGAHTVAFGNFLSVLDVFGLALIVRDLAAPHLDEEGRSLRRVKGRHK